MGQGLTKAIVMTRGRTGSTAIIDELGKAADCRSEQELFSAQPDLTYFDFLPFNEWRRGTPELEALLDERRLAGVYLQVLEGETRNAGCDALFWKALSQHFTERPYLSALIGNHGYKAIYLKRGAVRQVLSGSVAKQRKRYNERGSFEDKNRYLIDLEEFRMLVNWERHSFDVDREFLKVNGIDFVDVDYEEYLADRSAFFGRIFGFLGLPTAVPPASDFVIMIDDLKATIENYDEVCEVAAELGEPL